MFENGLRERRILVIEDEYMLADDLCHELTQAGVTVLGPVGTVRDAIDLIGAEEHIDGAIMDVNLRGEMAFPAADELVRRGVPFVFTTGYDSSVIPPRFDHVVRCEKPANLGKTVQAIAKVVQASLVRG